MAWFERKARPKVSLRRGKPNRVSVNPNVMAKHLSQTEIG